MQDLVMATNNAGKIQEMKTILHQFNLLSLSDIGFAQNIPEPYETFEENAQTKAQTIFNYCGKNVFADDSGICVKALQNKPGVHSAYFGGHPRSDDKNNIALLEALKDVEDRRAFYKAIICLIWEGKPHYFEGICEGNILHTPKGDGGFGYDPLFIPNGYEVSFGELDKTVKNSISHRAKALEKMIAFVREQIQF